MEGILYFPPSSFLYFVDQTPFPSNLFIFGLLLKYVKNGLQKGVVWYLRNYFKRNARLRNTHFIQRPHPSSRPKTRYTSGGTLQWCTLVSLRRCHPVSVEERRKRGMFLRTGRTFEHWKLYHRWNLLLNKTFELERFGVKRVDTFPLSFLWTEYLGKSNEIRCNDLVTFWLSKYQLNFFLEM